MTYLNTYTEPDTQWSPGGGHEGDRPCEDFGVGTPTPQSLCSDNFPKKPQPLLQWPRPGQTGAGLLSPRSLPGTPLYEVKTFLL